MRVTKSSAICALILLLVGLLCWRESVGGLFRSVERCAALWVVSAGATKDSSVLMPPTLVFQGGTDENQLSALDIGLFARAARKLSARVIGTTTYDFPRSEVSLSIPRQNEEHPVYVAGTLLMQRSAKAGLPPIALPSLNPQEWKIEAFPGSFSGFFPGSGWQGGFLNLPSQAENAGRFPVLARHDNTIVASFPLAALLATLPAIDPSSVTGSPADGVRIGSWILPLAEDGSLPLNVSLLGSLRRVDMDDVLVNVERLDRGGEPDPAIAELFAGQSVFLGTLGAASGESSIRLDSGRQFSLVEFQGLALASLQTALLPAMPPWWGNLLVLMISVACGVLIFQTARSRRFWVALIFFSGGILFSIAFFSSSGLVPLMIPPMAILLTALVISPLLDSRRSRPEPSIP